MDDIGNMISWCLLKFPLAEPQLFPQILGPTFSVLQTSKLEEPCSKGSRHASPWRFPFALHDGRRLQCQCFLRSGACHRPMREVYHWYHGHGRRKGLVSSLAPSKRAAPWIPTTQHEGIYFEVDTPDCEATATGELLKRCRT